MEILAQISQEAIAGYLVFGGTVLVPIGLGVIAIYSKLAKIETNLEGLREWLSSVADGDIPAMARLDERVHIVEVRLRKIDAAILRCKTCRDSMASVEKDNASE